MSILCRLFGHKFPKVYNLMESIPCNQWDDCDIQDHRMTVYTYLCIRCHLMIKKKYYGISNGYLNTVYEELNRE